MSIIRRVRFLEVVVIFLFVVVIFNDNYRITDTYWTPLRAIGYFLSTWSSDEFDLLNYIKLTTHNDSVKFFPTSIELLSAIALGYWSPVASKIIGVIVWIFIYFLLNSIAEKTFEKEYEVETTILKIVLLFSFFSTLDGEDRFNTVFAIHRSLPLFCCIVVLQHIYLRKNNRPNFYLIILCCFISQWSFANGGFLWLIVLLSALNPLRRWSNISDQYFRSIMIAFLLSTFAYLYFFTASHMVGLTKQTSSMYNANGYLDVAFDFTLNYTFYITNFFHSFLSYEYIIVLIILSIVLFKKFEGYLCLNDLSRMIVKSKELDRFFIFWVFLAINYSIVIPLNIISRDSLEVPARYFIEATIFSYSILVIMSFLIVKLTKKRFLMFFLLAIILSLLFEKSSSFYLISIKDKIHDEVDKNIVSCINNKGHELSSYDLNNECKLGDGFYYWKKENRDKHPFVKIEDEEQYNKYLKLFFLGKP